MKIRMEQGRLISNNLKAERGYRNPSFLQKMVEHHEIDQYGSAFVKQWGRKEDVFDPHALHEEVSLCTGCHSTDAGTATLRSMQSACFLCCCLSAGGERALLYDWMRQI